MRVTKPYSRRRFLSGLADFSVAMVFPALAAASSSPVVVDNTLGTRTFAAPPRRIVALQWDLLENVIGLGITPVGAADIDGWTAWVKDPPLPPGIASVGTRAEPNLERIAALRPDLILLGQTQRDLVPLLSKMSPVLLYENYRADAQLGEAETAMEQFRELAHITRREAVAEALLTRIHEEMFSWQEKIKAAYGTIPAVQVIRFSSKTTVFVYTRNSIAAYCLEHMGIRQPLEKPNASYGLTQVRIRDLKNLEDAYVLWIQPFSQAKKVLHSILWAATPFARKGHVASVNPYWSHGGAPSIGITASRLATALLTLAPASKEQP